MMLLSFSGVHHIFTLGERRCRDVRPILRCLRLCVASENETGVMLRRSVQSFNRVVSYFPL